METETAMEAAGSSAVMSSAWVPEVSLLPEGGKMTLDERRMSQSVVSEAAVRLAERRGEKTIGVYRQRWQDWVRYCVREGVDALRPDDVGSVSEWLLDMERRGMTLSTMKVSLSALRMLCGELRLDVFPPTGADRDLREAWEYVRRRRSGDGAGPGGYGKARALRPGELRLIAAWLERQAKSGRGERRTWRRDRAAYGLMFLGALRLGELLALERDDVSPVDGGFQVLLRKSKGDRERKGVRVYVHGTPKIPVGRWLTDWLDEWTDRRAAEKRPSSDLRLFALGPSQFRRNLFRAAEGAGVSTAGLRSHSMRAGLATWMSEADAAPMSIREALRHRDIRTTMGYVRQVSGRRRAVRNARRLAEFEAAEVGEAA